jgi:hypothetical protein
MEPCHLRAAEVDVVVLVVLAGQVIGSPPARGSTNAATPSRKNKP